MKIKNDNFKITIHLFPAFLEGSWTPKITLNLVFCILSLRSLADAHSAGPRQRWNVVACKSPSQSGCQKRKDKIEGSGTWGCVFFENCAQVEPKIHLKALKFHLNTVKK